MKGRNLENVFQSIYTLRNVWSCGRGQPTKAFSKSTAHIFAFRRAARLEFWWSALEVDEGDQRSKTSGFRSEVLCLSFGLVCFCFGALICVVHAWGPHVDHRRRRPMLLPKARSLYHSLAAFAQKNQQNFVTC